LRLVLQGVGKTLKPDLVKLQYSELHGLVLSSFGVENDSSLKLTYTYKDEEGEMITFSSHGELEEAIATSLMAGGPLELFVNANKSLVLREAKEPEKPEVKAPEKAIEEHPLLKKHLVEFARHGNLPLGSSVDSESHLRKEWIVTNVGACDVPRSSARAFSGDRLGVEGKEENFSFEVGVDTTVSLNFVAPRESGRYVSIVRLWNDDDGFFGPHLVLDIAVAEKEEKKSADVVEKPVEKPIEEPKVSDEGSDGAKLELKYGKHNVAIQTLWDMGYKDVGLNLYLLNKYKGDIQSVCTYLVDNGK